PVMPNWLQPSHKYSTDPWSYVESPPASNAPPSSCSTKNPSITCLNDYKPVALTSVVMKAFKNLGLPEVHHMSCAGPPPAVYLPGKQGAKALP
ncbi:hypothetical protein P4O66_015362, partial [Electrophorus voltai]